MSAESLETALRSRGIHCRVGARDRLALLLPDEDFAAGDLAGLEDTAFRRETVALAREHGFTHVALELVDEPAGDAAVHRD